MILHNHGTLTVGRSIASAFYRMYALEWACCAQVRTLSMGRKVRLPTRATTCIYTDFDAYGLGRFRNAITLPTGITNRVLSPDRERE